MDPTMFLTPELLLNPYPMYASMRQFQPVLNIPDAGLWLVFRYDDVRTVLTDYARFSSDLGGLGTAAGASAAGMQSGPMDINFGASIIGMDPPRHRKLRDIVTRAFTPRTVAAMEPRIAAI